MKKLLFISFLAALLMMYSAGCGPTVVTVSVVRPALVDLVGIDKIMMGGISGPGGPELGKNLSLVIANHQHYTLLDDAYFKGLIAKGYTVEFGGTAFIQGNVTVHSYTENLKQEVKKNVKGEDETHYRKTGTAVVEAVLKVVDPNNGTILGMRHLRKTAVASVRSINEKPRPINKESLLGSARGKLVGDFMKLIVPYRERVGLTFADEKNIPEMEGAVQLVKAGQWDAAIAEYDRIAGLYGSTPGVNSGAAVFNKGLCQIVKKQYDESIASFNKAMRLSPVLASRAGFEISKVKRLQADIVRLKKQMEGGGTQTQVTVVKKAEPEPQPEPEKKPDKPEDKPKTDPRRGPRIPRGLTIKGTTSWITGGVEAKLLSVNTLAPTMRSIFKMPIQVAQGNKLIGVRGSYKNLTQQYKNYAYLKMSAPQLPEITLVTDKGKTYFRSMHTLGLMIPFQGLKPNAKTAAWTVFEIPQDEKAVKLMGIVNGQTIVWELMK